MWPPTGLIPWFSKTEGNTYATLLHHPFLFGEIQRSAQEVATRFLAPLPGSLYKKSTYQVPIAIPISCITLFAICLSLYSPPLHPCRFIRPLFSVRLFFVCFLFARVLDCLLVTMAQDNTKLCDFTNNHKGINNTFIALGASGCLVCAGIRWLVCYLLLD